MVIFNSYFRCSNLNHMYKILLLLFILSFTLSAKAQIDGKFMEGSYTDTLGNRYKGLIKLTVAVGGTLFSPKTHLTYKENKTAFEKEVAIYEAKSFTMAADSFVISRNPGLKKVPVLMVMLDTPVKIYFTRFLAHGNFLLTTKENLYLIGEDPDRLAEITRKNFKEIMSHIMGDKPQILANIQNGLYRYGDLDDMIKTYKTR